MRKRLIMGVVAASLLAVTLPGVASAAKVTTKDACKSGGWEALADENGVFTSKKACTDFVKAGGTPTPPEPPLPDGVFAIAYVNVDRAPGFGPDDVLIAKWVDENLSGAPDEDDVIEMGVSYPITTVEPVQFGTFAHTRHIVTGDVLTRDDGNVRQLRGRGDTTDFIHYFSHSSAAETYGEQGWSDADNSGVTLEITDGLSDSYPDNQIWVQSRYTASRPSQEVQLADGANDGDFVFIDVDISF